ncbi:unnamed protein product, partial [Rotaria socialis]
PNAKQRTVLRLKDKIENLPRGTSAQIRNFSIRQRRRRLHISSLRADNIKLRESVRILTKEIKQLRSSRTPTPPPDSPSKFFFDNVSPNAKQRTVLRLKDKIENLPRGTSAQIR